MTATAVARPHTHLAKPLDAAFVMEQDVGHAVQALHLRRELLRLDDVYSRHVPVTFYEPQGLIERLRFLPPTVRASLRARRQVLTGLSPSRQPDALFWNTQKPALFCRGLLARVPSVISLDVTPRQYDELAAEYGHAPDRPSPLATLKHRWNKSVFNQAFRLLPATAWAGRSLVEDYDVPPDRVEVLPPGTDLDRFRPDRSEGGSERSKLSVLFVGGDLHRKGGDIVLDWFRTLTRRDVELHIVTRDAIEPGQAIVHRLTYEDEALPELYRRSDIFVLPTRAECFGLVLTEAMASGLPCVTCPVGGVPEVVLNGVTGLHTQPGDPASFSQAMDTLLADPALRQRMGNAGRLRAEERFDARRNVRRIVEILRDARKSKSLAPKADQAGWRRS